MSWLSAATKSPSKIFFALAISFIIGVAIHSFWQSPTEPLIWLGIFIFGLTLGVILFWRFKTVALFLLMISFVSFGLLRFVWSFPPSGSESLEPFIGDEVRVTGVISREVDLRNTTQRLTVSDIEVLDVARGGKLLLTTSRYPIFSYGDKVEFSCQIEQPEEIDGFRYDLYLARFGVTAICYSALPPKLVDSGQGFFPKEVLLGVKDVFTHSLERVFPEPHASFLAGLLYGARRSLPESVLDAFTRTGTMHIVAVSGYNISVVAAVLFAILLRTVFNRRHAFWIVAIGIFVYMFFAGAESSVVRAAIMGFLVLLSRHTGRMQYTRNVFAATVAIMLLVNPRVLAFDAGFQLSFLATVGLISLVPRIESWFQFLPQRFGLRESLVSTLAATAMTAPLIIFQFGRFSVASIFVNLLILPFIPVAMLFGFLAALVGFVSTGLAVAVGSIAWFVLTYILIIIRWFAALPFADVAIDHWRTVIMIVGYAVVLGFYFFTRKKEVEL